MFQCGTVKTTVRVRACSFSVIMFVAWGLCLVFTVLWNRQFRAELAARGTSVSARDLLFRPNFTVWKDKTPRKGKRRNEKEQDQWDKKKKKAEKERRKLAIRFKRKSEGAKASERICGSVHPSVRGLHEAPAPCGCGFYSFTRGETWPTATALHCGLEYVKVMFRHLFGFAGMWIAVKKLKTTWSLVWSGDDRWQTTECIFVYYRG
jgi:hypothetical protein